MKSDQLNTGKSVKTVIEIEEMHGRIDWERYPVSIKINGKESTLDNLRQYVLKFQPRENKSFGSLGSK